VENNSSDLPKCEVCPRPATHEVDREFCKTGGYVTCWTLTYDYHKCPNCNVLGTKELKRKEKESK
jgi:hypothetical protein